MGIVKTRVRVVSLRSFEPLIAGLSPAAFRAWQRSLDWSCFHATNGELTATDIQAIRPTPAAKEELLAKGVWKTDQDGRTFVAELREGPVVAEVEGREVEHRSKAALKQKRYRDRKRNTEGNAGGNALPVTQGVTLPGNEGESVTGNGVTGGTIGGSGSGSSPDPESYSDLTCSSEDLTGSARDSEPRAEGARASRSHGKTAFPDGFPGQIQRSELLEYGRTKGLRDCQILEQLEALELWARGKGERKADWIATAKGWLRRHASEGRDYSTPPGAPRVATGARPVAVRDVQPPYHEPAKPRAEVPMSERLPAAEIASLARSALRGLPGQAANGKDAPESQQTPAAAISRPAGVGS